MKRYKYFLCMLLGGLLFVSCSDFLDKPPIDQFIDDEFWQNESQARAFLYGPPASGAAGVYESLFSGFGTGTTVPSLVSDLGDDGVSGADQGNYSPSEVPDTDGSWSFTSIRKANYIIESAPRMNEPEATINHWVGIGRFLRGYYYSSLTFQYGNVPYMDRVPQYSNKKEDLDYLFKNRDPRNFVVEKNIEDFEFVLENVRLNDGALQINRYVAAALISRVMLREGTFQKYFYENEEMAVKCLELAKKASELVMSGPFSLSPSYKALFTSFDLSGNPEIIMYRKYLDGVLQHNIVTWNYTEAQGGINKAFAESFLRSDGFPFYHYNEMHWPAQKAEEFFANRDPRLTDVLRPKYCLQGGSNSPFNYSLSGYSWRKYMDDAWTEDRDDNPMKGTNFLSGGKNITHAPVLRLGEVLLNYAEICYELERLTHAGVFNQGILDMTINKLRDRVGMPHLEMIGKNPAVNGETYEDPYRKICNPDDNDETGVTAMLWEIRRERRVELCFEGLRSNDLKRWRKLDYLCNQHNPDFRYGAYIRLIDYPAAVAGNVILTHKTDPVTVDTLFEDVRVKEGYILRNTGQKRGLPAAKNYVKPIPQDQIDLYERRGYILTQTEGWERKQP